MRRALLALFAALGLPAAAADLLSYRDVLERPAPKAGQRIAYGSDPRQFAHLWLPDAARHGKGPHPVVVMIHGGCWLASLPGVELTAHASAALRDQGFAVWEIEYRRVGHDGGGYPGTFQDVAAGTDHLRTLAAANALDLDRVIATGHSAGGHLALWLAARPRLPAGSTLKRPDPLPIRSVVGLAAIADLAHYADHGGGCGKPVPELVGKAARGEAAFADTSPDRLLPIGVKQVLVQGELDRIVPPALALRHRAGAAAKGESVEVVAIPGIGHYEVIAPWVPAWKAVAAAFEGVRAARP